MGMSRSVSHINLRLRWVSLQLPEEDVDDPHRITVYDRVLETFGKQGALSVFLTRHVSLHVSGIM